MKYVFKTPCEFLFEAPPNLASDEILYGTLLYADADSDRAYIKVTTEYGYSGYAKREKLVYYREKSLKKYIVASPHADLLYSPEYKFVPAATLFRGSVVYAEDYDERFMRVHGYNAEIYYTHKANLCERPKRVNPREAWDELREKVVNSALSYLDTPYRWAGKSPAGIDCSGLCFMAHYMNGITIGRDSHPDKKYVSIREELKKGDMIHFKNHVALYIGDNLFIHSNGKDGKTAYGSLDRENIYYREDLSPLSFSSAFK